MFAYLTNTLNKFFPHMTACITRRREARYAARIAHRRQSCYIRPRLEGLEDRALLSVYVFSPPGANSSWTTSGNWAVDGVQVNTLPGSGDTADIPASSPTCVLSSTTQQTVAGLTVEGTLEVDSKLSVTTMKTTGVFDLPTGGELDVLGSADFGTSGTLSGKIDAQGSSVTFDPLSSMVLGSGVQLTGSGVYDIYGSVTCDAALSQNSTMVLANDGVTTAGSLTGPGSMTESGEFDWDGGSLGLSGGMGFIASADLKIQGADGKTLSSGTLTNQCNGSEIGGTGTLLIAPGATFDNLGNPNCDVTISSISIMGGPGSTGTFINDADGIFTEPGTTTISGDFINLGYLEVGAGAALTLSSAAPVGPATELDGTLLLDGDLTLLGSVTSPTGFSMGPGGGTLKVGDGTTTSSLTIGSGYEALLTSGTLEVTSTGTLTGAGTLDNNSGIVQLDLNSSTANLGAFMQTPSGQLTLQAGVMNQFSSLNVTGNASLGGTLNLDLLDGYTPPSGTVFPVLTAGSTTHEFNVTPSEMTATYGAGTLTLTEN